MSTQGICAHQPDRSWRGTYIRPVPGLPEVDPATRAKMVANRRVDTKPEVRLRRAVHSFGLRFRKDFRVRLGHGRSDPRPDLVFTRVKVAVFVDGCFWHACPQHGHIPGSNSAYWTAKFDTNVDRDRRNDRALRQAGWHVVRIWEHVPVDEAAALVRQAYESASKADAPEDSSTLGGPGVHARRHSVP